MGNEYHYYLGYKLKSQIYPLGPYNNQHKLCAVEWHCNRDTDLVHIMNYMDPDLCSITLLQDLLGDNQPNWSNSDITNYIKWLPLGKLPMDSPVKSGYYLIKDVIDYQEDRRDIDDLFYDHLTPEAYAAKLSSEIALGYPPKDQEDCEGFPIHIPSANEYMYFTYTDKWCDEYVCQQLRQEFSRLIDNYDDYRDIRNEMIPVVILMM